MGAHPVYVHHEQGRSWRSFIPAWAPLVAGLLEEVDRARAVALSRCGGAGVFRTGEIAAGHLVVPTSAVRDEGTSYHYLPPGREATPSAAGVAAIEATLGRRHVPYVLAKTWTTDGIYRETRGKMALRRAEGCVTVEMEAAALFAVAQFRGAHLAQVLYGGDNLDADEWDSRDWQSRSDVRKMLVQLAAEASLAIDGSAWGMRATPACGRRKASPTGVRRYQLVNDPSSRRQVGRFGHIEGVLCAASRSNSTPKPGSVGGEQIAGRAIPAAQVRRRSTPRRSCAAAPARRSWASQG